MVEFFLGDPVEKIVNGKTLRVEPKADHTDIIYGDDVFVLSEETFYEGLARAFEWGLNYQKEIGNVVDK